MMARDEIQMFVLWEKARSAETRILSDIATQAEVLASFEASWPKELSAQDAYNRFYGPLLPDAAEKASRSGTGAFVVVLVRFPRARYDWRMTQRGLEYVNLDMFELKWTYREWVGGNNRVHGTLSEEECRRDVALLTGHTVDEWAQGKVTQKDAVVLPGQQGWKNLAEFFTLFNETHPYVVLRNAEELPAAFDPVHGDIDLLVRNAKDCARCLNARKKKGGAAAYAVRIGGHDVHVDIREVGDDYYDERWECGILERRVLNDRGFYEPAAEDAFHSLAYHCLYQKQWLAPDYYGKLARLASAAGVTGQTPEAWALALDGYLRQHGYTCPQPKDASVKFGRVRAGWRQAADEATALFGLTDVRPCVPSYRTLELEATMGGRPVRVWFVPANDGTILREYDLGRTLFEKSPEAVAEPLRWHIGRRGVHYVSAKPHGRCLKELIERGLLPQGAALERLASSSLELIAKLEDAKLVHRDIRPETLFVSEDGRLSLGGFCFAIKRSAYKTEIPLLRRNPAKALIPLGGAGVAVPGEWNDRYALAQCLKLLPKHSALEAAIAKLEAEAKDGKGVLKANVKKLRLRLLLLYLEVVFRGLLSPKRRKSAIFRRIRAFVQHALF